MQEVAIITGTTSGIGYYIASYYYKEGYYVIGINRQTIIPPKPPIHQNFYFDLSDIPGIESAITDLKKIIETEELGEITVFTNNAGVMYLDEYLDYRDTILIDFEAPIVLCLAMLNHELITKGHIINVASVSGIVGDQDAPIYSACKAGIINFTRSLAKMLTPYIRVNCISPGFFKTNLIEEDTPQELIDNVPMQREADPTEIIPVIHMLQCSTYMTGANIVIDGGLSL